uniref:Uncharacterized protein n=1 Tax=Rangifer tarandus platyrhynchus TaxID=3082113 RepID=A0ACB0F0A4_RANTA|nr:unnamed protein product [Rangifer tarandus platyrhynchus]
MRQGVELHHPLGSRAAALIQRACVPAAALGGRGGELPLAPVQAACSEACVADFSSPAQPLLLRGSFRREAGFGKVQE